MANQEISFTDFPEDIQVCILSFLAPSEIATLACTSKQLGSLCGRDSKLWFSMCQRRWGSKTRITQWGNAKGTISYRHLYNTLHHWENFLGFWRRSGLNPLLLFFEWGPSFISASRVSPSESLAYGVTKTPFLWMSLSEEGDVVTFLDPDGKPDGERGIQSELIAVDVSFMGKTHFVVEEKQFKSFISDDCGDEVVESGSPPEKLKAEIYQHFANRRSPGGDRSRRQRRREKERLARRKWESQHFVKIVNCSPTPERPLQGLWKGICNDRSLAFYLVGYDDIGGISCRRIGDHPKYAPFFWVSNATFLESPFPPEEESLYAGRVHVRPLQPVNEILEQFLLLDDEVMNGIQEVRISENVVNRILHIRSNYDLGVPTGNPKSVEGRIWQYQDGTFGFGFLSDNLVVHMKPIVHNGFIVDTVKAPAN
ncbi:F-box protein At3g12350 [Vigna umbellata]|uniref:F-box protein At3g12350 n=1 Tax=Vigna umbellata TaxID=87088 RepID=UPI001F5E74E7|nr:F-box protein At3g12350 [Vigna umbellata]